MHQGSRGWPTRVGPPVTREWPWLVRCVQVGRAQLRSLLQLKQLAAVEAAAMSGAKVASSAVRIQSLQDPDGSGALKLLPVILYEQLQRAEAVQVTLK